MGNLPKQDLANMDYELFNELTFFVRNELDTNLIQTDRLI